MKHMARRGIQYARNFISVEVTRLIVEIQCNLRYLNFHHPYAWIIQTLCLGLYINAYVNK